MWPIALPQTKVVHLLRLAWATVVVSVNQSEIRQRDGNKSLRYQAYRLRFSCVSKANTSKGWKQLDGGIKRIGCVSTVRSGSTRQTDRLRFEG
jgi:hypothetical protein